MFKKFFKKPKNQTTLAIVLLVASSLALIASFELSLEKLRLLENPAAELSCSVNAVLNCASVMKTPQASLLGFPNSFMGLMAYSVLIFFALGLLLKNKFNKTILRIIFAGSSMAFLFALWLFFDSVYVIQVLCPWCLLTTTTTTIIFACVTRLSLQEKIFNLSASMQKKIDGLLSNQYDVVLTATLIVVFALLIVLKFGDALIQ